MPPRSHGKSNTPEYKAWTNMRQRCLVPTNPDFRNYGGRGIRICTRWLDSFENFYEDMGPKPGPDFTIDRLNPDGDYTPENCEWATRRAQARSKRTTKHKSVIAGLEAEVARLRGLLEAAGIYAG